MPKTLKEFTRVLKEEIKNHPAIKGANFDVVRSAVCNRLNLSAKEFDEILGWAIGTGRLENVWLFTGGGQAKIYHDNLNKATTMPFDTIEEAGEGIFLKKVVQLNRTSPSFSLG